MSFASPTYLLLLSVTLVVCTLLPRGRAIRYWLIFVSAVYFSVSGIKDLLIFLVVFELCFVFAIIIDTHRSKKLLALFIAVIFTPLFLVKYYPFLVSNIPAMDVLHMKNESAKTALFFLSGLPIGISFYTFQGIAYVVDVYRGEFRAVRSQSRTALFIMYFPQLIAGPIERAAHLLPQLKKVEDKGFVDGRMNYGIALIAMGLVLKAVIADNLSSFIDPFYNNPAAYSDTDAIRAVYYFSMQIYGDFYGYTLIALGSGHMMGIDLINNFNHPYFSTNIQNFWRRWHISLTNWFRDYVYIPLGGNRVSPLRNAFNLILILFLVGLWHGANWTFVVWGALHGAAMVLHRLYTLTVGKVGFVAKAHGSILGKALGFLVTFHFVALAWVFFRGADFHTAGVILHKVFRGLGSLDVFTAANYRPTYHMALFLGGVAFSLADYLFSPAKWFEESGLVTRLLVAAVFSLLFYLGSPDAVRFIYFRF